MAQVAGMTLAQATPILKEYYGQQKVVNELMRKHAFMAMLAKEDDFSGKSYPQPVGFGASVAYNQFGIAQTNQTPDLFAEFQGTILTGYTLASLQNSALRASRNDKGAFLNLLKSRVDYAMDAQTRSDATQLYRDGSGTIGKMASDTSGLIQLDNAFDALFFQKGAVLQASATSGGAPAAGLGYVTGSDVSTGQITVSATPGGATGDPSGWSISTPYLCLQGNQNTAISGLGAWIPASNRPVVGTPQTFMGVDRSQDPTRLAGTYLDASGANIEAGLTRLIANIRAVGGNPDVAFMGTPSYTALQLELQSRRAYVEDTITNDAGITFPGIRVGNVTVIEDMDCIAKTVFALEMSTWKLVSYGPSPDILMYEDGITAFREANNDAVEARIGGYRQLMCSAPGHNGRATLPA